MVPLVGAVAGCHCSVLSLWGEGVGRAAIVVCYGLGQSTLRERTVDVAGCHCRVPLECGMVDGGIFLPDSDSYWGFTSNRGGGRRTTLVDGRGTSVPLYVVPLLCHCRVPLQCAMLRGEGEGQLWRSGRGAMLGVRVKVPLLGAIKGCHSSVP